MKGIPIQLQGTIVLVWQISWLNVIMLNTFCSSKRLLNFNKAQRRKRNHRVLRERAPPAMGQASLRSSLSSVSNFLSWMGSLRLAKCFVRSKFLRGREVRGGRKMFMKKKKKKKRKKNWSRGGGLKMKKKRKEKRLTVIRSRCDNTLALEATSAPYLHFCQWVNKPITWKQAWAVSEIGNSFLKKLSFVNWVNWPKIIQTMFIYVGPRILG